jgi:hypothetical protein
LFSNCERRFVDIFRSEAWWIACAQIKLTAFTGLTLGLPTLMFERLAATVYRLDYERKTRFHIPLFILSAQYGVSVFFNMTDVQQRLGARKILTLLTFL